MKIKICGFLLTLVLLLGAWAPGWTVSAATAASDFPCEYELDQAGNATLTKFTGSKSVGAVVEVPSTVDGHPVTAIGRECFKDCFRGRKIPTSVTLPEGVRSIANYAFEGCEEMNQLTLPSSLTSIGSMVFNQCFALTELTLPAALTQTGTSLFVECTSLANLYVAPESAVYQSIDGVLFTKDGRELVYYPPGRPSAVYTVPQGTEVIGVTAFSTARKLQQILLPDGLTKISQNAFSYAIKLAGIQIPDGVTTVGFQAFDSCASLRYAVFPESCVNIGGSSDSLVYSIFKDLKNVTVIAPAGSTAAQYASSHNFPYEETRFRDVMDQIAALGSVTTEDQSRVEAARAAYNALSSLQKSLVTNADRLTHAEEMLHLLLNGIGDLDGNGFFGLVDVVLLRQGILAEEWNPSGDLNQDQRMSVSDVVLLRNIILSQV